MFFALSEIWDQKTVSATIFASIYDFLCFGFHSKRNLRLMAGSTFVCVCFFFLIQRIVALDKGRGKLLRIIKIIGIENLTKKSFISFAQKNYAFELHGSIILSTFFPIFSVRWYYSMRKKGRPGKGCAQEFEQFFFSRIFWYVITRKCVGAKQSITTNLQIVYAFLCFKRRIIRNENIFPLRCFFFAVRFVNAAAIYSRDRT